MESNNIKRVIKDLKTLQKVIPYFIDTTNRDDKKIYDIIYYIISLFKECCVDVILDKKYLDELSTIYYTNLIVIYNLKTDITDESLEYISNIYDQLMIDLQESELYESASNLYKVVNITV